VQCGGSSTGKLVTILHLLTVRTPGKVVDINRTSPFTAMPLQLTPLEAAFQ